MKVKGRIPVLVLLCLVLLGTSVSYAGEAFVTRVRRSKLTIDQGAEAGLVVGMSVMIVRPPGEAVIHPETGENYGAFEIELGKGKISKTSGRSATIQVGDNLLMPVQPGFMVRFVTPEEEMLNEQDTAIAHQESAQQERQQIKSDVSRLTRSINKVQGDIGGLRKALQRLDRIEAALKTQINSINTDIQEMQGDIVGLKETVALMGAAPVLLGNEGEQGGFNLEDEESRAQLEQVILGVVQKEIADKTVPAQPTMTEEDKMEMASEEDPFAVEDEIEGDPAEEQSAMQKFWYLFLMLGIGIVGVVGYLVYMKMMEGGDEDEEEEEEEYEGDDEEYEGDDEDDEEFEVEEDEEDDIVVEETA
jgi:hypothetical protein